MHDVLYNLWYDKATARKFWVSLAGALVVIAGQGLLPDSVSKWVVVIGSLVTTGSVYAVKNKEPESLDEAKAEGVVPVDVEAGELVTGELNEHYGTPEDKDNVEEFLGWTNEDLENEYRGK
jgi:hypothetical protein